MKTLKSNKRRWIATPTSSARNDGQKRIKGFTLVELVITIAIVIILSVISVPIYRNYTDKAKWAEAYAIAGTLLSAQKSYYAEYGNFLRHADSDGYTSYDHVLGIDARGNKYFTYFHSGSGSNEDPKCYFRSNVLASEKDSEGRYILYMEFNTTSGVKYALI